MSMMGTAPIPTLPWDLLVEILLRLPIKSLVRCKSVSKWWRSQISSPSIAKAHFNRIENSNSLTHNQRLLILAQGSLLISKSFDSVFGDGTPPLRRNFPFLVSKRSLCVVGSCNGLVCLGFDSYQSFLIWNPSTGFCKHLSPGINTSLYKSNLLFKHGFGYDSSRDDYVVFLAYRDVDAVPSETHVDVFSISTCSWIKCEQPDHDLILSELLHGLYSSGSLHWLFQVPGNQDSKIIAYDLSERKFGKVAFPSAVANKSKFKFSTLSVLKGCLSLNCLELDQWGFQIWIMKEYKVTASWTKLIRIQPSTGIDYRFMIPLCISNTESGEILLVNDWDNQRFCKFYIRESEKEGVYEYMGRCSVKKYSMRFMFQGVYTESLFSLSGVESTCILPPITTL